MIKMIPSTEEDIVRLIVWTDVDEWHKGQDNPTWWLTGNGLLAFVLTDDNGPLCYVRLDRDGDLVRLHTQFGPAEHVGKLRLVRGMVKCIPAMIEVAKKNEARGLVFSSSSPTLVAFMKNKFGFELAQDGDYVLVFGDV